MYVLSNERKYGKDLKTGEPYDYISVRGVVVKRNKEGRTYLDIDKCVIYPVNGSYDGLFIPAVGSYALSVKGIGMIPSPEGLDERYAPAILADILERSSL